MGAAYVISWDSPDCNLKEHLTQTSLNIKGIFRLGGGKVLSLRDHHEHNLGASLISAHQDLAT